MDDMLDGVIVWLDEGAPFVVVGVVWLAADREVFVPVGPVIAVVVVTVGAVDSGLATVAVVETVDVVIIISLR